METLTNFFSGISPIWGALIATCFTWFVTAAGSSLVFFMKDMNRQVMDGMLGFTGGVMIAASFWSLLSPAIAMAEDDPDVAAWVPAAVGFALGAIFLYVMDKTLPHLHLNFEKSESEGIKTNWNKTVLLVLAITLHNIPEGLAVGVAFGAVAADLPHADLGAAIALAIGIGLQNFPEGLAVSMPLRRQGVSRLKSFWYGQLSGLVEPFAGIIGAVAVLYIEPMLPYALAFAAGAMVYIVVEEVIPESQRDKYTDTSTLGFIGGFIIMMILDVALG